MYTNINKKHYSNLNFEVDGNEVTFDFYINKIKEDGFWMGDLMRI